MEGCSRTPEQVHQRVASEKQNPLLDHTHKADLQHFCQEEGAKAPPERGAGLTHPCRKCWAEVKAATEGSTSPSFEGLTFHFRQRHEVFMAIVNKDMTVQILGTLYPSIVGKIKRIKN